MPQMGPMNWIILYMLFLSSLVMFYLMIWSYLNLTIWQKGYTLSKVKSLYKNIW